MMQTFRIQINQNALMSKQVYSQECDTISKGCLKTDTAEFTLC